MNLESQRKTKIIYTRGGQNFFLVFGTIFIAQLVVSNMQVSFKATVLQIILENHELCKYAKKSLHIHIIVDLNQNIA